jgi:hypothetical protein
MGQHVADFVPRCVFQVTARVIVLGYFTTAVTSGFRRDGDRRISLAVRFKGAGTHPRMTRRGMFAPRRI